MENVQDRHTHATMSPARIDTLADGVFAIAMTLLAFDLVVPEVAPGKDPVGAPRPHLRAQWPIRALRI